MKVHTTAFKEQIKEMGRELDSIITFGDTVLGAEELNAVTPSFQGAILKSVMKQLDIDSNVEIPVGTTLNYKFGVKVNGEYEYLNFGNYIVKDVEKQEDTMSYKITCYDKMLYSMTDYVDIGVTYPITIREYINKICSFLGISFANNVTSFVNFNKKIDHELYLDASGNSIGYTFRDVFDELAQVTASTICINDNDQLEIRYIRDTYDTIDEEFLKNVNVNFGEKYGKINSIVLSRSGESDNVYLRDETSVEENGLCELKIIDNQIMNWNDRSDYLPEILNKLNGLEYYLNDFASTGIAYYDLCDRYNVVVGEQTYSCVMFNDEILVTQGLEENVFTEMPEETKTDYTKADKTDRKINQTYLIVDKQNQQIESVVSQTDAQNQKIAQVTQTVEELNSKISDIADITTSQESNNGYLEFEDINQSEPIRIVIRPIGESITNIYPRNNLYPTNQKIPATEGLMPTEILTPSEMLVPLTKIPEQDIVYPRNRKIRFENTTTGIIVDYELPDDLLYCEVESKPQVIEWDGDTTDRENIDNQYYKVSDLTPTKEELIGQTFETVSFGNLEIKIIEETSIEELDGGMFTIENVIFVVPVTTTFDGFEITKGTYFACVDQFLCVTKLTLPAKQDENIKNYDEFILDYDALSCVINKRVGRNNDGSVYILDVPTTIEYEFPHIELEDGSYKIQLIGYETAYIFVRLMAQNIYTTQFATRAEVTSEISQTAQEINLEVSKKVNETEVVSTINQSAEQITLIGNRLVVEANNFKLTANGDMSCNSGDIGGWTIQESGLTNGKIFIRNDGYSTIYTASDIFILRAILQGESWATVENGSEEFKRYDLNNDGELNSGDLLLLRKLIGFIE